MDAFQRHSGESFTYFAGSGRSKADMPTQADWSAYLARFQELREHPIGFAWIKQWLVEQNQAFRGEESNE
jgi:hypothetical protein